MPEGDTIARAAAALHRALAGRVVTAFATGLAPLARVDDDTPIAGRTIEHCRSAGKHLLMAFSGGLLLRTHMRMSGSWHLYRPGERWQRPARAARIRIDTDAWVAVAFDVPVAEFVREADLHRHRPLAMLGPDLADPSFDRADALARITASGDRAIGEVLLDQRVVAGIGNVLRSETLVRGRPPSGNAGGPAECGDLDAAAGRRRRAAAAERPARRRPDEKHDRAARPRPGALGLSAHRRALPPLRHRGDVRGARTRGAPRLLVSGVPVS